jgi:hypothetical protein
VSEEYAPVVWRRYQPRQPDVTRPADTRILAYRLDTRLVLIYPDASPLDLLVQQAEPGDYVAVFVAGSAVAELGSAFFAVPARKFTRVWELAPEQ